MGLFDRLFGKKTEPVIEPVKAEPKVKKPRKPKEKKPDPVVSAKDRATAAGEPYVNVLSMEIDPANIHDGSFELDWNEIFIAKLVKTGYMKSKEDTDRDIIDRWFQDVCRTIVLEMYEQQDADPTNRDLRMVRTKNIGDGRTEVS